MKLKYRQALCPVMYTLQISLPNKQKQSNQNWRNISALTYDLWPDNASQTFFILASFHTKLFLITDGFCDESQVTHSRRKVVKYRTVFFSPTIYVWYDIRDFLFLLLADHKQKCKLSLFIIFSWWKFWSEKYTSMTR